MIGAADTKPILTVQDLVAEATTPDGTVRIVDGVSFAVRGGRSLALVGESGSGKSVTCLSVLGLPPAGVRVSSGSIRLGDADLLGKSSAELNALRGREIGMILQDPMTSLNPLLTIGQQITEMFRYHEGIRSRRASEARAIELLRRVRVPAPEHRLNSYPHQFSGGMRQRVSIAMNLACNPTLLIADEPTTALDVTIRLQILDLLREIQLERGTGIVLVTHDLHIVRRYCDDVAIMYAGRIVEQGPVDAVFTQPRHPYTRGLLGAVPRLRELKHRLTVIPGQPPLPGSIAAGCRFAARCTRAQGDCTTTCPPARALDAGRVVACWHPEPVPAPIEPLLEGTTS
ncbi:ABC transporter ATP-binding protein [Burkholderia cepacia]|uniref:ABC transporter ATP-binding protein n=1 Tax=Burkholderia cepacia TaxID=292 RepID=UPI002AB75F0C|nr:ABC transporter ATP-binding protein [Burkholderia cepacia]